MDYHKYVVHWLDDSEPMKQPFCIRELATEYKRFLATCARYDHKITSIELVEY